MISSFFLYLLEIGYHYCCFLDVGPQPLSTWRGVGVRLEHETKELMKNN